MFAGRKRKADQDVAKLMLVGQGAPSLTALTFAAAVAHAARDAEEERRLIDQALAADEAGDPDAAAESINQPRLAMVHALARNLTSRPRPSRSATPSRTGYTPMSRNRYRPRWRA